MKILLADASLTIVHFVTQAKEAKPYSFASALTAEEFWEKLPSFKPDLILLDLMLPRMHGIEILRKLKADKEFSTIGVILLSAEPMLQNYHAASIHGANYFLNKPFSLSQLFSLIEEYQKGTLRIAPFVSIEKMPEYSNQQEYAPPHPNPDNYIKFWGTRGSHAISGAEYVRFGGNTSALEVRCGKDVVVIDAGTGVRPLGEALKYEKDTIIHLFIGHTHLDHIAGFPFFKPLYDPNAKLHIYAPIGFEKTTYDLFTDILAYSYFPVRLDDIKAQLAFIDLRDGDSIQIGDLKVETHYAYHPGSTLCFKVRTKNKTFTHITDNEVLMGFHGNPNEIKKDHPLLIPHQSLIRFLSDCDFVIHEAQYSPEEYHHRVGWGHSSLSNATAIMKIAGVKDWIVIHHDPLHTDEDLFKKMQLHFEVLLDCNFDCRLRMAFDSWMLPL